MATNLLLEGDDLEALLIKAHAQGGPNARIVRADKYRHGGVWGFFARERFEVAVEIPEATPAPAAAEPPTPTGTAPSPSPQAPAGTGSGTGAGAARASGRRALRTAEELPTGRPVGTAYGVTAGPRPRPDAGLLQIADRVDAAERAAARAAEAIMAERRDADLAHRAAELATPLLTRSITLPDRASADRASRSSPQGSGPSSPRSSSSWTSGSSPTANAPTHRPLGTSTNGTVNATMSSPTRTDPFGSAPYDTDRHSPDRHSPDRHSPDRQHPLDVLTAVEALAAGGERVCAPVPHEPSLSPVRPSTSRPEFTALLDQLREGVRAPRPRSRPRTEADLPTPTPAPSELTATVPPRSEPAATAPVLSEAVPTAASLVREPAASAAVADQPEPGGPAACGPTGPTGPTGPSQSKGGTDSEDAGLGVRQADPRTAADRRALRRLGVPAAWTRRLRSGDRFAEVLRMLERMPDPDIDAAAGVVAVVGPAPAVRLEAHRTAVDLAVTDQPRPVVVVPATVGTERAAAIARALRTGPVVIAVETDGEDAGLVLDTLTTVQADAVIAVVDAGGALERLQRWVDALGQVDALALDGACSVTDPAAVLQLGLPVIRLDGIPVDRVTWAALLCAQLMAAESGAAAGTPTRGSGGGPGGTGRTR